MQFINIFVRRDYLKNKVLKAKNDVRNTSVTIVNHIISVKFHAIRNELKKKGFNSFNKNVPFWNVYKDRFRIKPLPLDLRM